MVDVGPREVLRELPGVGREAVKVPPLALGEDDIVDEGRLAGAAQARHDNELALGDLDVDVFQIVLPGAADDDPLPPRAGPDAGPNGSGPQRRAGQRRRHEGRRGGARARGDLLGRSRRDEFAALPPAARSQIDTPVGALRDLHVVLDHADGVPRGDQAVDEGEQRGDVRQVQALGRLVQDEEAARAPGIHDVRQELDALELAARERRQRLADPEVPEAELLHDAEGAGHGRFGREQLTGLGAGQVEDVGNGVAAVPHLEHLGAVALSAAFVAGDINVGQELHLDPFRALALAHGALAAGRIEREVPRREAGAPGLRHGRESLPDAVEESDIRGRVRPRRARGRRLVHEGRLAHVFQALDAVAGPRFALRRPSPRHGGAPEHVHQQRALARPRGAGHADERAQREAAREVLEVVAARAGDPDGGAPRESAPARHRDLLLAAHERPGARTGRPRHLRRRAVGDHPAAAMPGAGPQVDQPVGVGQQQRVVLDDDDRVALVPDPAQNSEEPFAVPGVQADARLVEDEERADETGAERRGEVHALQFAAGEGARLPAQREVAEAHVAQVFQARGDLAAQEAEGHIAAARRFGEDRRGPLHRQVPDLGERQAPHAPRQGLGPHARAAARRTGVVAAETGDEDAHVHLVLLALEPLEEAPHAAEAPAALHDEPARLLGQLAVGHIDGNPARLAELQHAAPPGAAPGRGERLDRAAAEGQLRIGHHPNRIDGHHAAEAAAGGASAQRAVEAEEPGSGRRHDVAAPRADAALGEDPHGAAARQLDLAAPDGERRLDALDPPRPRLPPRQAVDDHAEAFSAEIGRRQVLDGGHLAAAQEAGEALSAQGVDDDGGRVEPAERHGRHHKRGSRDALEARGRVGRRGRAHGRAAGRAPGLARSGEDELEVVIDRGQGSDRGARALDAAGGLNRQRRRNALDGLDLGTRQALQELAHVRREGLDVAALALGVQGVEGEAGLPRSADARDHGEGVEADDQVEAREVVLRGAADRDAACPSVPLHGPRGFRTLGPAGTRGILLQLLDLHEGVKEVLKIFLHLDDAALELLHALVVLRPACFRRRLVGRRERVAALAGATLQLADVALQLGDAVEVLPGLLGIVMPEQAPNPAVDRGQLLPQGGELRHDLILLEHEDRVAQLVDQHGRLVLVERRPLDTENPPNLRLELA